MSICRISFVYAVIVEHLLATNSGIHTEFDGVHGSTLMHWLFPECNFSVRMHGMQLELWSFNREA